MSDTKTEQTTPDPATAEAALLHMQHEAERLEEALARAQGALAAAEGELARVKADAARAGELPTAIAARDAAERERDAAAERADGTKKVLADLRRVLAEYAAAAAAARGAAKPATGFRVAEVKQGAPDAAGRKVQEIYAREAGRFAIYRAGGGVWVQFSDGEEEAAAQRARVASVAAPRWQADALAARYWRNGGYQRDLAAALTLAVQGDEDGARAKLTNLAATLEAESARVGRAQHVAAAVACWGLSVAALFVFSEWIRPFAVPVENVWQAGKAGATGALLSLLIAFRARVAAPDTKVLSNVLEAAVRIGIGVLAGGALLIAYGSGFVARLSGGGAPGLEGIQSVSIANWQTVVMIGFLAGFAERLVPGLFDRAPAQPPSVPAPAGTPPNAPPGGGADRGGVNPAK